MASVDDNFDPNDLDSIDALLDEAEKEVSENLGSDPVMDDLDNLDGLDDLELGDLSDDLGSNELSEVEVDSLDDKPLPDNDESALEQLPEEVAAAAPMAKEKQSSAKSMAEPEEEFVSKRAKSNKTSPNEVSVAEMDSIKKLVIIFGSVLIVLVLTAIGMGVWSALAASGGLDEETQTMIEDIKAGTETNTMATSESTKTVKSVEKKLDALSFQLEQLTSDIAALEMSSKSKASAEAPVPAVISPILDSHGKPIAGNHAQPAPVAVAAPVAHVAPVSDQVVLEKLNVVSSKMASAQKRIDEVNKRVKSIQSQYGQLMHSVKVVEKQMVDQQAKEAKVAKEKEKPVADERSNYQYNRTPDAMYYDQSNPDSYP